VWVCGFVANALVLFRTYPLARPGPWSSQVTA